MLIDTWDSRIADLVKALSVFVEETAYPITWNEHNALNTVWGLYNDPHTGLIVDYCNDEIAGFSIVHRTNEFHSEYFGHLGKFYVLPHKRQTRTAFRLMHESVDWFDKHGCIVSFASGTAEVGGDKAFVKLLSRFGYTATGTGVLTRSIHEQSI